MSHPESVRNFPYDGPPPAHGTVEMHLCMFETSFLRLCMREVRANRAFFDEAPYSSEPIMREMIHCPFPTIDLSLSLFACCQFVAHPVGGVYPKPKHYADQDETVGEVLSTQVKA